MMEEINDAELGSEIGTPSELPDVANAEEMGTEPIPEVSPAAECENTTPSRMQGDLEELKEEFPELAETNSVTELPNPIRYAALRDLGLSPGEAYLLSSRRKIVQDNRAHLTTGVPRAAKSPATRLSGREMEEMRELFGNISDSEIYSLYKRVTK